MKGMVILVYDEILDPFTVWNWFVCLHFCKMKHHLEYRHFTNYSVICNFYAFVYHGLKEETVKERRDS